LHQRPDLVFGEARGNVETRLKKLDEGQFDGLLLAVAGLRRLGLEPRISCRLEPPLMYAAVGQGALGIECRDDDALSRELLQAIEHAEARARVTAERALLAQLRAGCHAPVGAATRIDAGTITLEAVVLSADGKQRLVSQSSAPLADAARLGAHVADKLLQQGAQVLIGG
jgi:hydroxymethylbilane synthase